jgi:hypothetical protein
MRVKALIGSEFTDVDPVDVIVTKVEERIGSRHSGPFLEAFGHVRGQGATVYRVAYTNDDGSWQTEGTTQRQTPPMPIMDQISFRIAWGPG